MEMMSQVQVTNAYENGNLEYNSTVGNIDFGITHNNGWCNPWDFYHDYHHYYPYPSYITLTPNKHEQGINVAKALIKNYVVSIKTPKEFIDFVDTIVGAL